MSFRILTDSACDIALEKLNKFSVQCIPMDFYFAGDTEKPEITLPEFYDRMKKGDVAKTSAINPDTFIRKFEEILKNGEDILYLSFSSGLSTTFNSATIAAYYLEKEYPDRKIRVVDSLCASSGQGLFVYLVCEKSKENLTLDELADYAESLKLNICHWFTVDDLIYLKRGGRVNPALAFVGGILGIKPILHVDNDGHLIKVSTARGRKSSIEALADKYGELAKDKYNGTVFISNGDCLADAEKLAQMLKERYKVKVKLISDIGAVIGAHSGPGTLALFFVGTER